MSATHSNDELRQIAQRSSNASERAMARNLLVARGVEVSTDE